MSFKHIITAIPGPCKPCKAILGVRAGTGSTYPLHGSYGLLWGYRGKKGTGELLPGSLGPTALISCTVSIKLLCVSLTRSSLLVTLHGLPDSPLDKSVDALTLGLCVGLDYLILRALHIQLDLL